MHNIKNYLQKLLKVSLGIITVLILTTPALAALKAPDVPQVTNVDIITLLGRIGTWLMGLAGMLAVVFLIYGGIVYITGGAKAEESAKKIIMNSIIGLIVVALSYVIANIAFQALGIATS